MQVPFHLPQLRRRAIDGPRPGLLQLADALLEPPRAEQAPDEPAIGGHGGPGHPGRGEYSCGADRERGVGARIGTDAEQHPVAGGQRVEDTNRAQPGAWRVVAEQRPPQRVGQVGQTDCGHVDREALQRGGRQLEQHVGHGPPGGAVPEPGVQPAQQTVAREERGWRGDPDAEQPSGQPAVQPGHFPGGAGGQDDQRQSQHRPHDRDGQDDPRHEQEHGAGETRYRKRHRDQAEQQVTVGAAGEGGAGDRPGGAGQPGREAAARGRRAGGSPGRRPPGEVTRIALPTGSLSRAGVPAGEQPAAGGQGDRGVQGQHAQPGPGRQGR